METSTRPQPTIGLSPDEARRLCIDSMLIMVSGTMADFERVVHPTAINCEAIDEPLASRVPGPKGFYATALWLREAFGDLAFAIHDVVIDGDLVVIHNTMSGRHHGPMVEYDADGEVATVFPPTGRTFATTQTHWFRVADSKVIEHWANRDDIGTAVQLGWVPPTPRYLFRMFRAKRVAKRAHADVRAR